MRVRRLLFVSVLLSFGLGLPIAVVAKQSGACEFAEKLALKKALKAVGGSIAAGDETDAVARTALSQTGRAVAGGVIVGMDAVIEYFTHPDDTRLDAAMHKLLEGGTKIVFPQYGMSVVAGRWFLGSPEKPGFASVTVQQVIDAGRSGQLDAFICGDRSYDNLFGQTSFFDLNAVRSQGITCENFTRRVNTAASLEQMRSLWFGYYKRQLLEMNPGSENQAQAARMLDQGWTRLEQSWKVVWADRLYAEMREALKRQAREIASQPSAKQCVAGSGEQPAKPSGDAARFAGVYASATSSLTIAASGTSITAHEEWASGGRNGTTDWKNCRMSGNSVACDWTGTYRGDPDKTGDRKGTLTASVSGNRLTGRYLEETPTFQWKVQPYPSAMHNGATWPIDFVRK